MALSDQMIRGHMEPGNGAGLAGRGVPHTQIGLCAQSLVSLPAHYGYEEPWTVSLKGDCSVYVPLPGLCSPPPLATAGTTRPDESPSHRFLFSFFGTFLNIINKALGSGWGSVGTALA